MAMASALDESSRSKCHHVNVVAIPYPGRGHVNSMMNTCRCLAACEQAQGLLITVVATEEWLQILASDPPLPSNIQLRPIPNVLPSETARSNDFPGFFQAVSTKMEEPVARVLDQFQQPPRFILADTMLLWAVPLGNRRSIPVVSLWPMSSAVPLSIFDRWDLPPASDADHPLDIRDYWLLRRSLEAVETIHGPGVPKAECLLIATFQELEPDATGKLKAYLKLPVYTVGPSIPYMTLDDDDSHRSTNLDYWEWLDSKPRRSVLYVSLGSHWTVSGAEADEIGAGLRASRAHFLWPARANVQHLQQICGDKGLIVPWCDQLRALCHPSIGAFFTHCGWNSTMESVFAGVIMAAFPLAADQRVNANLIVDEWKVGVRITRREQAARSEDVAGAVKRVMDLEGNEGRDMRSRAEKLQEACKRAIGVGGSSCANIIACLKHVLRGRA